VKAVLGGIGLLMMVATVIPIVRADAWWIRVFDFPRLQITAVLAATLIGYLFVREDSSMRDACFLGALALSLGYQLYRMYPYTRLARQQVERSVRATPETTISLLISNVFMDNRKAERLRELIREQDPDVILTVETDEWWERELATFEKSHPFVVKQAQDNTYGMHLFSRLELVNPRVRFLVEDDIPSIHTSVKLRSGKTIELRCVHPRPPAPAESTRSTERDAELLIVGKDLKGKDVPAIVIGDLNDVAWSHTNDLFQSISGLLDPRIGRGFFSTFNANWPVMRFPLDHAFSSPDFRLITFKRLQHSGSDHFPVFVKLSFEPEAKAEQPQLQATTAEKQEANEKIENADDRSA
jgi:endonuclease/exonuclease/phosphatase (EEP) superfamily protein YafD